MKNRKVRIILIVFSIMVILAVLVVAVKFYNANSIQKQEDEFDFAREEYKNTVENSSLYNNVNDKVKSVEVVCEYEDEIISEYTCYQHNVEYVTVYLDDSIEGLKEFDKCAFFSSIIFDIREITQKTFNNSLYRKIFDDRKIAYSMDYKGREIEIFHNCEVWNFSFITSGKKYLIETDRNKSYDGRYILRDYDIAEDKANLYLFSYDYQYGTISNFETKSTYDAKERTRMLKKEAQSNKKSSSDKTTTYDLYDVQNYKSAQDFADDKYEEFYDYEDDYEDEDEAYDAAEDYWYD